MKVVMTRELPGTAEERIRAAGHEVWVYRENKSIPKSVLLEQVRDCDALVCLLTDRIDSQVLAAAPNLKVVANYAVGFENIDVEDCLGRKIVVTNTPDVLTEATADMAFALLLGAARHLAEGHQLTRDGHFTGWQPGLLLGHAVHGATLGIVGMGRIGQAVARRAAGFSMRVLYTSRSPWPQAQTCSAQQVVLEDLLAESDFISLHAPLTPETHHIINQAALNQVKSSAVLINTARGGLLDQSALLQALTEGKLAAAALDVFDPEPPEPQDPILSHPKVLLAPHTGSATVQARTEMADLAVDNLLAVLENKPPPSPVQI